MAIPFDPNEIIDTLGEEIIAITNELGGGFISAVVPATPVDTGHARRNWQVNIGAANKQELPGVDKAGTNTITNAKSRLEASKNRNPFLPIYLENNAPYIGRLNDGFSPQAPSSFVEKALILAAHSLDETKVL